MIKEVLKLQKTKKFIINGLIFFVLFMILFTVVDHLNNSYSKMLSDFGAVVLITHIALNLIMSLLSAFMFNLSSALSILSSKEGKGSFFTAIAFLFGIVTYGCTPCVVAFFSVVGITLVVTVLPLAGLLYKVIALGILIVGLALLFIEIKYFKCKINTKVNKNLE